jgi:hypothetical protein
MLGDLKGIGQWYDRGKMSEPAVFRPVRSRRWRSAW